MAETVLDECAKMDVFHDMKAAKLRKQGSQRSMIMYERVRKRGRIQLLKINHIIARNLYVRF